MEYLILYSSNLRSKINILSAWRNKDKFKGFLHDQPALYTCIKVKAHDIKYENVQIN